MKFLRDNDGCYHNTGQFREIGIRFNKDANLWFVKAFYNDEGSLEVIGFKTQKEAQDYLDKGMGWEAVN